MGVPSDIYTAPKEEVKGCSLYVSITKNNLEKEIYNKFERIKLVKRIFKKILHFVKNDEKS